MAYRVPTGSTRGLRFRFLVLGGWYICLVTVFQGFGPLAGRLKKFPNFQMKHYRVEFIVGTSRAKRPTVQLKSFAPFFWVGGVRVCVWYMSWGFREVRLGFGVPRAHFGSPEASLRALFGQN